MPPSSGLRVAIVHEKFTVHAGSEKVVEQLHLLWPDAPIHCAVCDPQTLSPILRDADIRPDARLQRLYRGGDNYAHLLPLLPRAHARHDLGAVDLVVTSHHQFAQRVRTSAPIVSYVHTPARWIWDPSLQRLEVGGPVGRLGLRAFAATQRRPDRRAARRPHTLIANSTAVAQRIHDWWGRTATVIAPPVDTEFFTPGSTTGDDYFLLAGRLVPYKQPEVAVRAATAAGVRLVVAGTGRSLDACRAVAGPTVEFVGAVDDDELRTLFRGARALVFPGLDDFGIVPVEAQACGTPVIALGAGGALDTVVPGRTGVLYERTGDEVATLAEVLRTFDRSTFDSSAIVDHARSFSPERFRTAVHAAATAAVPDPTTRAPR